MAEGSRKLSVSSHPVVSDCSTSYSVISAADASFESRYSNFSGGRGGMCGHCIHRNISISWESNRGTLPNFGYFISPCASDILRYGISNRVLIVW